MARLRIRRADLSVSLDGKLRIEGKSARVFANLLLSRQDQFLRSLRRIVPKIKASDIQLDSLGRVVVDNAKAVEIAQFIADAEEIEDVRKKFPQAGANATESPEDVAPPRDRGYVNFFCPSPDGLDLVCGEFDDDPDLNCCCANPST